MDFSKLTSTQVINFLNLHDAPIDDKFRNNVKMAKQVFKKVYSSWGPNGRYTPEIRDLYVAYEYIPKNCDIRYDAASVYYTDINMLSPLFRIFDIEPTEQNRGRLINILNYGNLIVNNINFIEQLPVEIQLILVENMDDNDMISFLMTCKSLYSFTQKEEFWRDRYNTLFGTTIPPQYCGLSWKQIYNKVGCNHSKLIDVEIPINSIHVLPVRIYSDDTYSSFYDRVEKKLNEAGLNFTKREDVKPPVYKIGSLLVYLTQNRCREFYRRDMELFEKSEGLVLVEDEEVENIHHITKVMFRCVILS